MDLHKTTFTYLMTHMSNTDSLPTQNYNAHVTINVHIHRLKTRSAATSMLIFAPTGIQRCLVMAAHSNNEHH